MVHSGSSSLSGYRLGLPMWSLADWQGAVYPDRAPVASWLGHYAALFNTVEGNTTFYAVPAAEAVARWRDAVSTDFRFCFKLPSDVTHRQALRGTDRELTTFLSRLEPLGSRLGPFLVQLPARFGPDDLDRLDAFLSRWPIGLDVGVELRHRAFFTEPATRRRVVERLAHYGAEWVLMDTRALRSGPADAPGVREAVARKPALPVDADLCGPQPMIRCVTHPYAAANTVVLAQWRDRFAVWLAEGRTPWMFLHCAENAFVPAIASCWHGALAGRVPGLGSVDLLGDGAPPAEQLSLF